MPHFKVKAVYDYSSPHEDDLSFLQGQIITVTEEEDEDWYIGEYTDGAGAKQEGLFPRNFVEKYEPEPPPRPNRASRHKPVETPATPVEPPSPEVPQEATPVQAEEKLEEPEPPKAIPPPVEIPAAAKAQVSPTSATSQTFPKSPALSQKPPASPKPAPVVPASAKPPASPKPAPAAPASAKPPPAPKPTPAAPASSKPPPPPVAEKSSSFRDRIAAFNKTAAPPIAPFKPGGGPPSSFIKKPFVAPPPSRNAYVPPIRNDPPPIKQYRREEDPEIAERTAQDRENAEKAGLTGGVAPPVATEEGEDNPKPTSLKERIALLQKQQMEQAQRAAQKEKPKRPPTKKRTESHEPSASHEGEGAEPEKLPSGEPADRGSSDISREPARPPQQRRLSHGMKSPDIIPQNRELFSDANDADQSGAGDTEDAEGTSTSVEDEDEKPRQHAPQIPIRAPAAPTEEPSVGEEEGAADEDEEDEEDEEDPEERRKRELRERMAKMSGGMGMAGMFGGGLPMAGGAPKKKKAPPPPRKSTDSANGQPAYSSLPQRMPMIPVPGMSMPGMTKAKSPESEDTEIEVGKENEGSHPITNARPPEEVPDVEDVKPVLPRAQTGDRGIPQPPPLPQQRPTPSSPSTERSAPPVPGERPAVPTSSRPIPPPALIRSPSPGSESDDEMPRSDATPPVSGATPQVPSHHQLPKRNSYFASDEMSQDSSTPISEKRSSRMPPIPLSSPTMSSPTQSRPPPPPPPGAPPSRQSTMDSIARRPTGGDRSEGETEYEGDYDTDIAPGATHKDALKSHAREISLDDSTTADDSPPTIRSPLSPGPPPLPQSAAPRAIPPPLPTLQPPSRRSLDAPRAAPPPIPPPRDAPLAEDDDDYDPYRYTAPSRPIPPPPPPGMPPPPIMPAPPTPHQHGENSSDDDDLYTSPPPRKSTDRPPPPPPQAPPHHPRALPHHDRPVPPPPPPEVVTSSRSVSKKSLDVPRQSMQQSRPSMDQARPSSDQGFIASDLDLGASTHWWTQPNAPPPSLKHRKDILIEVDETRSGNSVEKVVFVLYMDYSQTVITARFNTRNASDITLEQRHDPPPARLRQDQLEAVHDRFGAHIAAAILKIQNTTVGDGTPHGLVLELLRPHPSALKPVAHRAYGALVYANLANASTLQYDEIRPGDIVTFRNARFQGKHGPMHASYKMDVGKPDHVGVVVDWDGTKKKIRAWEQGRESRKVKVESFKLGDLRSGEVRVWRVMGKNWIGWGG